MNPAQAVIDAVAARGFCFTLYEPRELNLTVPHGKGEQVTDALRAAIKEFREEIIVTLNLQPVPKPKAPPRLLPYEGIGEFDELPAPPDSAIAAATVPKPAGKPTLWRYRTEEAEPFLWTWPGAKFWYPWRESA